MTATERPKTSGPVCSACIREEGLAAYVKHHGEEGLCAWCRQQAVVLDLGEVGSFVHACIRNHYLRADEELFYDDEAESGYAGSTYDADDLFRLEEVDIENSDLRWALIHSAGGEVWCDDPGLMPLHFTLRKSWAAFEERIKSGRRFFAAKETPAEIDDEPDHPDRLLTIEETLKEVFAHSESIGLFRLLQPDVKLFRARTYSAGAPPPESAQDFGPPPAPLARANRMSAAGIPMLYAALDATTAELEVPTVPGEGIAIRAFVSTRPLLILDLTKLIIPSIFDEERGAHRESYLFLKRVAERISDPIIRDGREHVEYVPTQAFAEYLRFEFRPDGERVDGVLFSSSRHDNGRCLALFATQGDLIANDSNGFLKLVSP